MRHIAKFDDLWDFQKLLEEKPEYINSIGMNNINIFDGRIYFDNITTKDRKLISQYNGAIFENHPTSG